MQQERTTPGVPRREAYTASVSPLVPVDPAPAKRRTSPESWCFLTVVYAVGLTAFAIANEGVAFFVWLLLGWAVWTWHRE